MAKPPPGIEIVDAHVHIHGPYLEASTLVDDLRANGISRAVIFASPIKGNGAKYVPFWYGRTINRTELGQSIVRLLSRSPLLGKVDNPNNDDVFRVAEAFPDTFLTLFFMNPYLESSLEELKTAVEQRGAIGIKIHLLIYPISLLDPRIVEAIEYASQRKLIVLIDLGSRLEAFDELQILAERYPQVSFIVPHLPPPLEKTLELASQNANIYLDTSSPQVTPEIVREALGAVGATRLIFGSDSPREMAGTMKYSIDVIEKSELSRSEKELIYAKNILRLIDRVDRRK